MKNISFLLFYMIRWVIISAFGAFANQSDVLQLQQRLAKINHLHASLFYTYYQPSIGKLWIKRPKRACNFLRNLPSPQSS